MLPSLHPLSNFLIKGFISHLNSYNYLLRSFCPSLVFFYTIFCGSFSSQKWSHNTPLHKNLQEIPMALMTKYILLKQNVQGGLPDLALVPSALGTTTLTLRAGVLLNSLLVPEQIVFFGPLSGMFSLPNLQIPLLPTYALLWYAPESLHYPPCHTHPVGVRVLSHRFISYPQHYRVQHICPSFTTWYVS